MKMFKNYHNKKTFDELSIEIEGLIEKKSYELAKAAARELLRIAEVEWPKNIRVIAECEERLASLLTSCGDNQEAIIYFSKAQQNYETIFGESHPTTLNCLLAIAKNHQLNYKHEESEEIMQRIAEICERNFQPNEEIYLKYLKEQIEFSDYHGDRTKVIDGYLKLLKIIEHHYCENEKDVAGIYNSLGQKYVREEKLFDAELCFLKAILLNQNSPNIDGTFIDFAINALAEVEFKLTNYTFANILFDQMLINAIDRFSYNDSRVADVYYKLGMVKYALCQFEQAEENWLHVIEINELVGYRTDDTKNNAVLNIAHLYRKAGDETKANDFIAANYVKPNVLY